MLWHNNVFYLWVDNKGNDNVVDRMIERFEIFPQNVAKDGTLIIIQKGLKLYNISDVVELLNELNGENKELKRENESLNSQLIRLDDELFCQDCLTCRHSKSININVECAEGEKEYHRYCDFYEISDEWVE